MERWFQYESGMPWCESAYKYQTLPMVAEFANTVTNLPIIVLPMINAMMLRDYIMEENWLIVMPNLLLTINGLASTFYHATLSLFGQLVDELALLWLVNMCVITYLPILKTYPAQYRHRIPEIRWAIVIITTLVSLLCFIKPSLNAFALMIVSIPSGFMIYQEGIKNGFPAAEKFTWRVFTCWGLAIAFWLADRLFCDFWLYLGTPYLHAMFHLLSSMAAYNIFVMFGLLEINRREGLHDFDAEIRYFPTDFETNKPLRWSVPYLALVRKAKRVE
ncbi:unnamed protein product [Bursaphelenchus okinawaensis]|uniref:Alkaline ceramidase n=1 Tax=Bursaphelenchus okinawaensis TaxID=465554 RepID=A0A811KAX7_9BILA|nr:unnamed protein product [Bursaphelenchus okinawaensis]CAG9098202.1 unnamed protein product [Bursaphelenchus okinawaensis]